MDWNFWYFVGLGWLSLAFLALPGVVGLIAVFWRGHGSRVDGFFARHGSLIGALISTAVTAVGVIAAWVAVQSQITASNEATRKQIDATNEATKKQIIATVETTKIQVDAALATDSQQIEEGRKQHRLEYLRQYLGQIEPALTWLHRAETGGYHLDFYARDTEPYKSQLQKDLDDEIAFMNAMPQMPFYDDKGTRPADRRDNVVEALKAYKVILAEPKRTEAYGEDDRIKKAADAVREADKWSDDYFAVSRLELDARDELKKLEAEIEYHPKRF